MPDKNDPVPYAYSQERVAHREAMREVVTELVARAEKNARELLEKSN